MNLPECLPDLHERGECQVGFDCWDMLVVVPTRQAIAAQSSKDVPSHRETLLCSYKTFGRVCCERWWMMKMERTDVSIAIVSVRGIVGQIHTQISRSRESQSQSQSQRVAVIATAAAVARSTTREGKGEDTYPAPAAAIRAMTLGGDGGGVGAVGSPSDGMLVMSSIYVRAKAHSRLSIRRSSSIMTGMCWADREAQQAHQVPHLSRLSSVSYSSSAPDANSETSADAKLETANGRLRERRMLWMTRESVLAARAPLQCQWFKSPISTVRALAKMLLRSWPRGTSDYPEFGTDPLPEAIHKSVDIFEDVVCSRAAIVSQKLIAEYKPGCHNHPLQSVLNREAVGPYWFQELRKSSSFGDFTVLHGFHLLKGLPDRGNSPMLLAQQEFCDSHAQTWRSSKLRTPLSLANTNALDEYVFWIFHILTQAEIYTPRLQQYKFTKRLNAIHLQQAPSLPSLFWTLLLTHLHTAPTKITLDLRSQPPTH
ncbi:uncharacterized protein MYCFIDRAFT_177509 [Pseudocercospora fijiensis CIRAD86]|uniref:Uncharacterized protein n=1 Tax=Pseudocercospora fijiensis (strain CIRAD86) TaxID=383855 RepID=M2YS51_PSEFD|nr:uncharacterized protein MYCFIDRAFT_177509 [Pseudocercospora fijiensis CIRAD86]EME80570.1 hypothetical protein MYCFIDRAFT_177509 [Pseudocercospora fijiensis CIRAD86]